MIKRAGLLNIVALCCVVLVASCSVTRNVPEGEYLLSRVDILPDLGSPVSERIAPDVLERYVRQSPNKRLFGFNFYLWVYNLANQDKDNWWNNLKRKIGEEPIYLSELLTERSRQNLNIYMDSQGFYSSSAAFAIDTLSKSKRARVVYSVEQGLPYKISICFF